MIWFNMDKLFLLFGRGKEKAIDLSLPHTKILFFYIHLYIEDAYIIVMSG